MKRIAIALLAGLLCIGGAAHATEAAAANAKPAATAKKAAKPSARGPGTQTEDELYIGVKGKTPQKAVVKPSARARTGDEDLEDLEVQRGKPNPK